MEMNYIEEKETTTTNSTTFNYSGSEIFKAIKGERGKIKMKKIFLALILLFTFSLVGCTTTTTEDPLVIAYQEGYAAGYEEGYNFVSWIAQDIVMDNLDVWTIQILLEEDRDKMILLVDELELTYKEKQNLKEYLSNLTEEEAIELRFTIKLWLKYNDIYE